jgi:hypothetical protein
VDTIIAGLPGNPLKICSGKEAIFDQHACDYNWDPGSAIGRIISAHREGGWINATSRVTDPTARSKIGSGTWSPKWSIFGGYKFEDHRHMRYGTIPRSVTLVDDPAYPGAGFTQAAGRSKSSSDKEVGNMTGEDDPKTYTQEELDQKVAEAVAADHATMTRQQDVLTKEQAEAQAAKDQEQAAALEARDKEIAALQAAAKEGGKKGDPGSDKTVPKDEVESMIAAAKEGMVPREDVEKMVAAATEQATANTMDLLHRQQLTGEIATMQASFGMIKEEEQAATITELMKKSSAALEQDRLMLQKMSAALEAHGQEAVDKFKAANLPAGGNTTALKLNWDPAKQEWM